MRVSAWVIALICCLPAKPNDALPPNQWTEVARDPAGARPGSAMRYVPEAHAFFLWGYMNDDPDLLQEQPLIRIPEYDMVTFDPATPKWRSDFPPAWAAQWSRQLPLAYVPRTYAGITTGSERVVVRGATDEAEAAPRPELTVVFDQVVYVPTLHSLVYFTGGTTAAYDVTQHRWRDLAPRHSPPPVLGGSLAYDSVHDDVLLFGGGHVAERSADGRPIGYTGTWAYDPRANDWRELHTPVQPPPRMNTRVVTDTRNNALIVFGGDGQSHYLADTWIFDLQTRSWRTSKTDRGPEARAGHFTAYDPDSGWVIIGGGYNRRDLSDMWAYDVREDRWRKLAGEVPAGFYLTADIAPDKRILVLATSTRKPGDRMSCNQLFPVRTTYVYRMETQGLVVNVQPAVQKAIAKRAPETDRAGDPIDWDRLPRNRWVLVTGTGRSAPTRTWGTATFDTDRERILYWGGGHCGYGGSDVDMYDIAGNTWRSSDEAPEYPERFWNHGVREAGVTFGGRPWMEHGRRIYAYDPVSRRMVVVRRLRLTSGYEPPVAKDAPARDNAAPDALVRPTSSYVKFVTWTFDPATSKWELTGSAPGGVDTLVSTPRGVIGIDVDWPSKLNDAGYQRVWKSSDARRAGVYLYDAAGRGWKRLDRASGDSPQNLYELTSLAYDSRRNQLILHGGGAKRDELWTFDMSSGQWRNMRPKATAAPPQCSREAVYLPGEDTFLTYDNGVWVWKPSENTWHSVEIPFDKPPKSSVGQNRAVVYDPKRDVVFLVLGAGGDDGVVQVYAMRYSGSK